MTGNTQESGWRSILVSATEISGRQWCSTSWMKMMAQEQRMQLSG